MGNKLTKCSISCFRMPQSPRYHNENHHPMTSYPVYPNSHDSIMQEVDVQMRHRPQPPPLNMSQQIPSAQQQQAIQRNLSSSGYDAQTAMRVRRWIESRTTPNVNDCRPILNAEIQRGVSLKKTNAVNDRSAPKIWPKSVGVKIEAFSWFFSFSSHVQYRADTRGLYRSQFQKLVCALRQIVCAICPTFEKLFTGVKVWPKVQNSLWNQPLYKADTRG